MPLAPAVFGAYLFCLLLFWLAGGFGPAPKARGWLLNVYNLLMVLVLGKVGCAGVAHLQAWHGCSELAWRR